MKLPLLGVLICCAVVLWLAAGAPRYEVVKTARRSAGLQLPVWTPVRWLSSEWDGPFGHSVARLDIPEEKMRMFDRRRCSRTVRAGELSSTIPSGEFSGGSATRVCIVPVEGGGDRDMLVIDRRAIFLIISD